MKGTKTKIVAVVGWLLAILQAVYDLLRQLPQ